MTDIPYQLVSWRIEDKVEGDGQLDYTETRGQMTACFCYRRDDGMADFRSKSVQLRNREAPDVLW
jgi:hypothetical protein